MAGVPTGHVFRVERKRGPAWYANYRLPDGRQVFSPEEVWALVRAAASDGLRMGELLALRLA